MATPVQPITIGPRNAVALTGCTWDHVRQLAERLGVPLLGDESEPMVDALQLRTALRRGGRRSRP